MIKNTSQTSIKLPSDNDFVAHTKDNDLTDYFLHEKKPKNLLFSRAKHIVHHPTDNKNVFNRQSYRRVKTKYCSNNTQQNSNYTQFKNFKNSNKQKKNAVLDMKNKNMTDLHLISSTYMILKSRCAILDLGHNKITSTGFNFLINKIN